MALAAHERSVVGTRAGHWLRLAERLGSACLSGPAEILFCSRPLTGAWFILAIGLLSPPHAVGLIVGLVTTTALAMAARWNRILLSRGLFGLNGALVGLVWPSLFPLGSPGFWLVIPAAAATLAVQGWLLPPFTRQDLPVLTLPFVLTVWGVMLLSPLTGLPVLQEVIPPSIVGPLAGWENPGLRQAVWDSVRAMAPGVVAFAVGIAVSSRIALQTALFGALLGMLLALGLGGLEGFFWIGSYAYSAAPVVVAVAGTFFPYSRRSLMIGALAGGVSVFVWTGLVWLIFPLGLFPLTLPLNGVLLSALSFARTALGKRLMRAQAIPLGEVEAPQPASILRRETRARPDEDTISKLESLIRRASKIMVITGAGVSTESRIPDYRSQIPFWFDANAEDLTYDRLLTSARSRRLYWRLQRRFFAALELATPNQTHWSLVHLEFREKKLLGIVTQNVDGLHQRAGSSPPKLVELHGNAEHVVCLGCGTRLSYTAVAFPSGSWPTCGGCGGLLKVDVVSIGEPIPLERVRQAREWCEETDLVLVLGTSLLVEPAASLPSMVRARGVPVVIMNRSATPFDAWATLTLRAPLGETWARLDHGLQHPLPGWRTRPMMRPDFLFLCRVVDFWWGDSVRYLLHPLFLEHFGTSSFVAESEDGEIVGFLVGVLSQSRPGEAYVHLVGTSPDYRKKGLGRALYEHFFKYAAALGCRRVSAITVPYNEVSLAFHRRMGFTPREAGAEWQGDLPVFPHYAGPGVDCVVMDRELTPKQP